MTTTIGLMGLGRIGRNLFRILYRSDDIKIGAIFDALSTKSQEDGYARVVSWYDNEWGYSARVVDLADMFNL